MGNASVAAWWDSRMRIGGARVASFADDGKIYDMLLASFGEVRLEKAATAASSGW